MSDFITELEELCAKYGVKLVSNVDSVEDKVLICRVYEVESLSDTDEPGGDL